MLVALAAGLLLMLAVLVVQLRASTQNMRIQDTNQRDNEVRAAMDMLTQDIASAGFLLTPGITNCAARLNYDSAVPSPYYFASTPIAAIASANNLQLPFAVANALTMNYPAAGSSNRSDVLVIRRAADSTQFADAVTPTTQAISNASYHPTSDGRLPVTSSARLTAGDVGLVLIPLNSQKVCLRVPLATLGTASSSSYVASSGTLMPASYYAGLSGSLATIGYTNGSLSDALLMQGKVLDMGTAANSNQVTYAYYVSSPSGSWPSLMRATINSMNDTVTTVQPIAAGVVSLQVLFGVDTAGGGSVTAYQTGATVASNNNFSRIRSIRIGLITRSLYADPTYTAPATLTIPGSSSSVPFTDFTVLATNNRHAVQTTEIALRNTLWSP